MPTRWLRSAALVPIESDGKLRVHAACGEKLIDEAM